LAAEKALALVVRGTDWSETSRIATLFTREFGKVRALAKGGRRLKSSFDVAFDLLTLCQVVFLRKSNGSLDLLTEARAEEQFPALRHNLHALYAGYYVAELLADGTQDYDPHSPLFDAALATLRALPGASAVPPGTEESVGFQISAFELVWLQELGYSPRLDACAGCGAERRNPTAGALFSPSSGGVLCPSCGPAVADRLAASGGALSTLRELEIGGRVPVPPAAVLTELRNLLGRTVTFVLGRRPRMLSYIQGR
jgi:DNA repair protein RecO (recombination protein O)